MPLDTEEPAKDKEIFPDKELSQLAIRWKELNRAGRHREAMDVLEEIVVGSTEMFQRLAQHEKFHFTVDLNVLVASAQLKIVRWLLAWKPNKGKLFSWFSKCAKNAFRSEAVKASQYRRRFHVTGDSLEKFFGADDHEVHKHDAAAEVHAKLAGLTCRWGCPQEIGAVRFVVECIISENHDRQRTIDGAAYCFGISQELAKFFYSYALMAMRNELHDRVHVPHTAQDLLRAEFTYTHLVDLLDIIGYDKLMRVIAVMGGCRLKIPTIAAIAKLREEYDVYREVDHSDFDPESVEAVARKARRSAKSAEEIYVKMSEVLDPKRSGEYEIFGET